MTSYSSAHFSLLRLFRNAAVALFAGSLFFSSGAIAKPPANPGTAAQHTTTAPPQAPREYFASRGDQTGQLSPNKKPVACAPRKKNNEVLTHYCWEITGKDVQKAAFTLPTVPAETGALQVQGVTRQAQPPVTSQLTGPEKRTQGLQGQTFLGSYYHASLSGNPMANGQPYDPSLLTTAHKFAPSGTQFTLINPKNGRGVRVVKTDVGPFVKGRAFDLSWMAAYKLGGLKEGVMKLYVADVQLPRRDGLTKLLEVEQRIEDHAGKVSAFLAKKGITPTPEQLRAAVAFLPGMDAIKLLRAHALNPQTSMGSLLTTFSGRGEKALGASGVESGMTVGGAIAVLQEKAKEATRPSKLGREWSATLKGTTFNGPS